MAVRPMLDDLELQQVQTIEVDGDQVWTQHGIPALEGDFFQGLGRCASRITLTGVLTGAEVADGLAQLRAKFRAAAPVSFVADIATATRIEEVVIEEMGVRAVAGKPSRFAYAFTLREYKPATLPGQVTPPAPPEIPPPRPPETAVLDVEVIVVGQPEFNHSQTQVEVTGQDDNGRDTRRTLADRSDNVWTADPFPPGSYTARATTTQPPMSGTADVLVPRGGRRRAVITLRPDVRLAQMIAIHFWFDTAFIEPCLRPVMRQVAEYAAAHPDQKLLIVGHTDLVGGDEYNQALSERRARSTYAYLTFGDSPDTAVAEWNELRKTRPTGTIRTVADTWGPRQYQQMLQALRYYTGAITDIHDSATDTVVRAFQADNALSADGIMGDQTWPVLIRAYLGLDNLSVPAAQFLPNARDGCDGGALRWLGHGEKDPLRDTQDAWRPNRRTEFLFVTDDAVATAVSLPRPVTHDLPAFSVPQWCLGKDSGPRTCSVRPHAGVQPKESCSVPDAARWERQRIDAETILVRGSIRREDGSPVPDAEFVLTSPEGEYLHTAGAAPDLGERPSGSRRGRPIPDQAEADGTFSYPEPRPTGVYTLELVNLPDPQVVRLADAPPSSATGKIVCKRLEPGADPSAPVDFDVVVMGQAVVGAGTTLKGKLFWNRTWDYNTAPQLPATAVSPPFKEFLPGAKVQLYIQKPGDPGLTLFQTIFLTTADKPEDPHGAFEFTAVPPAQRAALRVLLEHRNAEAVVIKGKNNAVTDADFKVETGKVVWQQFEIDAGKWNRLTPEVNLGDVEIKRDHFIDLCDAYKSIWFGHRQLKALAEFDIRQCQVNYPEPPSGTSFEQNEQLFIKKDDLKDRDVLLHEYAHFIMDVIGRLPPHPGYLYNDAPGHGRTSKEHYEAAWIEGPATFIACSMQDDEHYHDGYDTDLSFHLATDNTTVGPHAEGSIQEALWRVTRVHGIRFKDGFWKALTDATVRAQINSTFDFYNNWKDLKLAGLDKLFEAYKRFSMEFGYEYLSGADRFTAVAAPATFDAATRRFRTVTELFNQFGTLGSGTLADYREEFYNRNKFFNPGALGAGSSPTDPKIVVGNRYIVPQRFQLTT